MAETTAVKKRGRPKKADQIIEDVVAVAAEEAPGNRRSARTKKVATDAGSVELEVKIPAKKTTRAKKITNVVDDKVTSTTAKVTASKREKPSSLLSQRAESDEPRVEITTKGLAKSRKKLEAPSSPSTTSSIAKQDNAVASTLKSQDISRTIESSPEAHSNLDASITSSSTLPPASSTSQLPKASAISSAEQSSPSTSAPSPDIATTTGSSQQSYLPVKESAQQSSMPASSSKQSSFLNSFLDASEPAPIAPESSKIVDRDAFKSKKDLSIEDIVRGSGVTNYSEPEHTTFSSKRSTRNSPLTSQTSSNDTAPTQPRPLSTVSAPTNLRSFTSHRISSFPDRPTHKSSPSASRLNIPPESYPASSFMALKSTPSLSSKPHPSSFSSTSTTHTASRPAPPSAMRKPLTSHSPPAAASSTPSLKPPRISSLPPDEIRKLPQYKSAYRNWTGIMVGVPSVIVLSYLLYGRVQTWREERVRAMRWEEPRERGSLKGVGVGGGFVVGKEN